MKKIIGLISVLLCGVLVFSQNSINIEKEYKKTKIDKKTEQVFVYQNDKLIEKGILVNGKREGVWQSFDDEGRITAEASFAEGKKNGVWLIYDNASLKYVLHYQNDKRVGANDLLVNQ
ncbi:MAG: hypothetical protein R2836_00135 [Chitinophagales bacterium]